MASQNTPPSASPTRKDQEQIELNLWLQDRTTQRVLSQLRQLYLAQCRNSVLLGLSPAADEITLRSSLTKAATIEELTNRIEKGDLDSSKLI